MAAFTYVYILRSIPAPSRHYVGLTTNLQSRLAKHNAGGNPHTAAHAPWQIQTAIAFTDEPRAAAFERYLKSGSGRAFAIRHL
jgi:predicted GIY-YIG superfamily endonuclease